MIKKLNFFTVAAVQNQHTMPKMQVAHAYITHLFKLLKNALKTNESGFYSLLQSTYLMHRVRNSHKKIIYFQQGNMKQFKRTNTLILCFRSTKGNIIDKDQSDDKQHKD
ncbi:unnamed protein product [Paramecium octaurelia]|uniref:Uncharacterized protein n=1 Tax=Paramecium octaurelia TaxID=43137 RepID=A0A8S1YJB9_PAROT|nr:unnamed protein product [Paramecium octaurelia]